MSYRAMLELHAFYTKCVYKTYAALHEAHQMFKKNKQMVSPMECHRCENTFCVESV